MTRLVCVLLAVAMLGGARLAAGADEKPGKSPEKRFARADKNGDKKLTLEEFVGKRQDEKKEKAVKRFGRLDKDNDEFLSLEEFMAGIKKKNK